jgi:tripartite-type tricarboxylate transporter receptor subunit TctC
LISYGKANPGKINFGHAGVGSGTHLNTVKLVRAAGVDVVQVPFKGTPEVVQAMLSGSVDCYWVPISAGISNIRAGKLHALAVSTAKRNAQLPDLPTTAEAGVKGADFGLWFGLWGPTGMPANVVTKVSADVRKALADPGVREKLINLGNTPMDMSPQEFARFVRSEIDDYARIVKAAGIKPQ